MTRIETARLRLRDFRPDDLEPYHSSIYGDAAVMRFLPGGQPRPREQARELMDYFIWHGQRYGYTIWAVEDLATGEFVGHAGPIRLEGTSEVELAYAFGRPFWGRGYAVEAGRASLRYAFETAALDHVYAMAYEANVASLRVMQKLGMRHIGKSSRYHSAELVLYDITREEFDPGDAPYTLA